jgi:hypothetical protein
VGELTAAEGTVVLFKPDFLDPETGALARLDDPTDRREPGFHERTHFSKFFHLRTGATPIAFRESVRGSGG